MLAPPTNIDSVPPASGPGWVTLLDGENMGDWNHVGTTNWRLEDGAVVADKRTSKRPAYLVTKVPYKNFQIYVEFWSSHDANSGIFIRCSKPGSIGAKSCYEVNIFDQRKDPTYGTGAVVNFVEVKPMPKAGGKWNTLEITAKGRRLEVVFNGQKTVDFRNGLFKEGPFALQHGGGVMKFRKVAIKSLDPARRQSAPIVASAARQRSPKADTGNKPVPARPFNTREKSHQLAPLPARLKDIAVGSLAGGERYFRLEEKRSSGIFVVQLGATYSMERAVKASGRLNRVHRSVLGSLKIAPVRADLGERGVFFRMRSGPLNDRASAESLCRKFLARKQRCIVVKT